MMIWVGQPHEQDYATVQALEQHMPANKIKLSFEEGLLFNPMDALSNGQSQAATLFSGPYYFAEQLGFRKIIVNTFMIATMLNGDPDPEDVAQALFQRAIRRIVRAHERFAGGHMGPGEYEG